jgi:hypothetical protein
LKPGNDPTKDVFSHVPQGLIPRSKSSPPNGEA